MNKKVISMFLILVMLSACMPCTAFAETMQGGTRYANGSCNYLTWVLDDGVLTISGTGDMQNFARESYVPWADSRDDITSVIIEEGVTSIGTYSFYGCTALTSIQIADVKERHWIQFN